MRARTAVGCLTIAAGAVLLTPGICAVYLLDGSAVTVGLVLASIVFLAIAWLALREVASWAERSGPRQKRSRNEESPE